MRVLLLLWSLFSLPGITISQIVISEIMFNPAGSEYQDEFVELANIGAEPVDVSGWLLGDEKLFMLTPVLGGSTQLDPGQFAVVLAPSYYEKSLGYESEIPPEALRLTVDGTRLGAYGLKNSGDFVRLLRPDSVCVADVTYIGDNEDGISEEKKILSGSDAPENWGNSLIQGGTPGRTNSLTPLSCDLALISVESNRPGFSTQDSVALQLTLANMGLQSLEVITLISDDSSAGRIVANKTVVSALAQGDTCEVEWRLPPQPAGMHTWRCRAVVAGDERPDNNSCFFTFRVWPRAEPGCIVINELMYNTDERDQEWIELAVCKDSVNVHGWTFADRRRSCVLADSICYIRDLVVLYDGEEAPCGSAMQVNIPELNNSGDALRLMDATGQVIDSVVYAADWGGARMQSLERIRVDAASDDPANWQSCDDPAGGTPGRINSVSPRTFDAMLAPGMRWESALPRQYAAATFCGDLVNVGRKPLTAVEVLLESRRDSSLPWQAIGKRQVEGLGMGDSLEFQMDWMSEESGWHHLRASIISTEDMNSENNSQAWPVYVSPDESPIILNEIMFAPAADSCEWVELYNRSGHAFDLHQWRLMDADSNACRFPDSAEVFRAGTFLVVGNHPGCDVVLKHFPTLNNDEEVVELMDVNGRRMDRVQYSFGTTPRRGYSYERINPDISASEPTNWAFCVDVRGHTAGRLNSIFTPAANSGTQVVITPNPFSPDADGHEDQAAINYQLEMTTAFLSIKIYDIRGRLVRFLTDNQPSAAAGTVFWDGRRDNGSRGRVGIYIVILEAMNQQSRHVETARATVVLAANF